MRSCSIALLTAIVLATAACSTGSNDTSSSIPSISVAPSTTLVTENFSGTVQPGLSDSHTFTVTADNAAITLALTSAGPPSTISMGFGIGQVVANTCQLLSGGFGTYTAGPTPQLSGTIPSGSYCVLVYDVGNQSAPVTYTVVVTHY